MFTIDIMNTKNNTLLIAAYIGLPMDTHSNLKYWPSCGMIIECVISRCGASAKDTPKTDEDIN